MCVRADSGMARHAFDTFIPLGVENSAARKQIIFDFFDLLAAISARGKTNGLGGRKLSRMAGWWAFEHTDAGSGFDGGYKAWAAAADACSHLFFAYLRSQSPDSGSGVSGITSLPRSLQALVSQTEYPPEAPSLMQSRTTRVVMIVDAVSPTPFALLRRAKNFEYRDDDRALQEFSNFEDPVQALTDECRRVLRSISSTNEKAAPSDGQGWSRFEDLGFSTFGNPSGNGNSNYPASISGDGSSPWGESRSRTDDLGRPTTPSWADFLSSGFADPNNPGNNPGTFLLPPDKSLPPLAPIVRVQSSQSHMKHGLQDVPALEPGELASITAFDLDETFWWVWMTSLATEEPAERKAVFGRCALIETNIHHGRWLVMEEQVKGAAPEPAEGAYIAEKKGKFSWTRGRRLGRKRSTSKKVPPPPPIPEPYNRAITESVMSKRSLAPDQHARVQAAAAKLKQRDAHAEREAARRGRQDESSAVKTNSVLTLQPHIANEAAPAMKWAKAFDKETIRAQYLNDKSAGTGRSRENLLNGSTSQINISSTNGMSAASTPRAIGPQRDSSPSTITPTHRDDALISPPLSAELQKTQTRNDNAIRPVDVPLAPPIGDEKPSEAPPVGKHPALRQPSPAANRDLTQTTTNTSESTVQANRKLYESKASEIPAPVKDAPKKLKKGNAGGGFKGIFGRRSHQRDEPAEPVVAESSSLTVPEGKRPGRSLSILRKKSPSTTALVEDENKAKADVASPVAAAPVVAAPEPPPAQVSPISPVTPATAPTPVLREEAAAKQEPPRPYSPVAEHEQKEADRAFSRFDQGPMEDMPAFVPEDSPAGTPRGATPQPISAPPPPAAVPPPAPVAAAPPPVRAAPAPVKPAPLPVKAAPAPPKAAPAPPREVPVAPVAVPRPSDVSDASESTTTEEPVVNMQDRWAQIRKAAAERAAAQRQSDEQGSARSADKTDDGDTSGEETIEARVARIKARVAELTGNDGSNSSRIPARR